MSFKLWEITELSLSSIKASDPFKFLQTERRQTEKDKEKRGRAENSSFLFFCSTASLSLSLSLSPIFEGIRPSVQILFIHTPHAYTGIPFYLHLLLSFWSCSIFRSVIGHYGIAPYFDLSLAITVLPHISICHWPLRSCSIFRSVIAHKSVIEYVPSVSCDSGSMSSFEGIL